MNVRPEEENPGLSIIVPAYNEAGALTGVLDELLTSVARLDVRFEILVVDDGSTDGTRDLLAGRRDVVALRHGRNRGYGASLKTGIARARYEHVLFFDADGQFNPEEISDLYRVALEADMAAGKRGKDSDAPFVRRPGKKILSWTANYLAKTPIPDLNCGFRIVRRAVLRRYAHLLPDGFSASTTLTLLLIKGGYDVRFVPVRVRRRTGTSTVNVLSDGFDTLMLIVRLITLLDPLRVFLPASGLLFTLAVAWGLRYFVVGKGISMATLFLMIAALLTFFIGLLADQVAALRREVNR